MHGITVVELGGEKRTLAFNMHFFQFLCRQLKCNPDEVVSKLAEIDLPLRALTIVIYCSIIGFLETEAIYDHDITLKQVSKWVGDANANEFTSVWETFSEIMEIPKASQEQIDAYVAKHSKPTEKKEQITWQSIFENAVINLSLSPQEFYKLTPYEYRCLSNRHTLNFHKEWAHTRMIAFTVARCNSTEKFTIEDFIPLLIDELPEAIPEITQERKEELMEIAKQRAAILNKNR